MYGFTTEFEPFAVGFLSCESENLSKKAASGLLRAAEKMNITVDPDLGLVYAFQGMNCTLTFGGGITCNEDGLERLREDYPESAADIRYIIDNMKGMRQVRRCLTHFPRQNSTFFIPDLCGEEHGQVTPFPSLRRLPHTERIL